MVESGVALVSTVAENKTKYANTDYSQAVLARKLQIKIGRPSTKDFTCIVTSNLLPNFPVTKADIMAAEDIFGPDVGSLKGKTTRCNPHAIRHVVEPLPASIMNRYRNIMLYADVMYVNKTPMLITISRDVQFGTVKAIPNRTVQTLIHGIWAVAAIYRRGGLRITLTLMDGEFDSLRGYLADDGISLNTTARDEHVGDVERYIRTVKERMHASYNMLPFRRIPTRLVIEMAKNSAFWQNASPHPKGISNTMSPHTIVTGKTVDYNRHCKHEFGEYVQTHEKHNKLMMPRTIGALDLRPTGNAQGCITTSACHLVA